ncbi:hypothetical protein TG4357_01680 [Thalassovita gelatinovora]|uniref:Uncharacterized protein n=1 Tax=Thalassovita gelatinovora TaxID=53501 RepID=A0A0P1FXI4_THAGE|nr:hypothetical protein TG4357_01680 [Thalassovita gelatinovora]
MVVFPAVAPMVPLQLSVIDAGSATSIPEGKASLRSILDAATKDVFSILMVNVDTLPWVIVLGVKDLLTLKTGAAVTVSIASAVPLLPSDEVKSFDELAAPAPDTDRTSTEIVQLLPAETDPPL